MIDMPHDLAAGYALDALDPQDRQEFDSHLPGCAECQAEVEETREALVGLAPVVDPPPALRDAVLAAVAAEPRSAPAPAPARGPASALAPEPLRRADLRAMRERRHPRRWMAGLAAAAVVAALVLTWRPWSSEPPPAPTAVSQVLEAPDAQQYPGPTGGPVSATVVRSAGEGRSVLVPNVLPDPGPGKTYQMWFVPPQGPPVSAGLLSGTGPVLLQGNGKDAAAVAVSVEPAGGSPQPTTTPVLVIPVT